MSSASDDKPECPLNDPDCAILNELVSLRASQAELSELVHSDTLTGLFNYRHFSMVLEQEMSRTRRTGHPLALVMLDLDHFKQVNDTHGHEVGNRVLAHVADVMRQVLRKSDIACRYGGEEFVVILPGTQLARAINAAERLRLHLEQSRLLLQDGSELAITASLGVSVYQRGSRVTGEAFIKEVDSFLYQAKETGRNRVSHPDLEAFRPKGHVGADEKAALFGDD